MRGTTTTVVGDRIVQQPLECALAVGAMCASVAAGVDATIAERVLRNVLRDPRRTGYRFDEIAKVLNDRYRLDAQAVQGLPLSSLVWRTRTYAVGLGIEAATFYRTNGSSPHAVLLAQATTLDVPDEYGERVDWAQVWPFVGLIDPSPLAPKERTVPFRELAHAYSTVGAGALLIPCTGLRA